MSRAYGRRWVQRSSILLNQPENAWCCLCARKGRTEPATMMDHIISRRILAGDAHLRLLRQRVEDILGLDLSIMLSADPDHPINLRPVCGTCNRRRNRREYDEAVELAAQVREAWYTEQCRRDPSTAPTIRRDDDRP